MFRVAPCWLLVLLLFSVEVVAANPILDRLLQGGSRNSGGQLASGLKEALRVGTERTVARLGATDGFNADPLVHIPLPKKVEQVRRLLRQVGMSDSLDRLELEMNRAAEAATPKAKALFVDAITQMSFEDARAIFSGPDDAATQYLRGKMSDPLAESMRPIVDQSLAKVGAVQTYDGVRTRVNAFPLAPKMDASLSDYVLERAMAGLFTYIAKEEAAIRKDPAKRSTELLKSVFGRS